MNDLPYCPIQAAKKLAKDCRMRPETLAETSGCSGHKTYYRDGLYLKTGVKGSLERERRSLEYFHMHGYAPAVALYESDRSDCLVTEALQGESALSSSLTRDPVRLARALGAALRRFHDGAFADCPFTYNAADMLTRVRKNAELGRVDASLTRYVGESDPAGLLAFIEDNAAALTDDATLHGDYCLPNVFFDRSYRLTGFIDLGKSGRGDRHYDLFWGVWSLNYNLGADRYGDDFLDAYGRDAVDPLRLRLAGYIACMDE